LHRQSFRLTKPSIVGIIAELSKPNLCMELGIK
jgi:hypothetical protein